jgi:superfamily II DNA/RNA helicase
MEHDLQKGMMYQRQQGVRIMVFSATFNNISVINVASVLLVEEIGENHDLPQVTDKLTTESYFIIET